MALLERTVIDRVEVLRTGDIQVRESMEIYDDQTNEIKSQTYHRFIVKSNDETPTAVQVFMDNSKHKNVSNVQSIPKTEPVLTKQKTISSKKQINKIKNK